MKERESKERLTHKAKRQTKKKESGNKALVFDDKKHVITCFE